MTSQRFAVLAALAVAACAKSDKAPDVQQAASAAAKPTTLATAPDQFFDTGGVRTRFRDVARVDSGTPIILIHGYSRSLEDWLAMADSLSANHRVIAYDVRGFGKSSKSGDPRQYGPRMADEVVSLMDHLQIPRAHLVGHSMGALIAGNVAVRYPDRVASASLIAGPFYSDSATFAKTQARWVNDLEHGVGLTKFLPWLFPGMPDSIVRAFSSEAMTQNDSVSMVATMRATPGMAITPARAAKATVPVFIAAGDKDPLTPTSRALAKAWPKSRLLVLPGMDHVAIVSRPEVLAGIRAIMQ